VETLPPLPHLEHGLNTRARVRRDHAFPKERLREGIDGPALPFNSRDSV